MQKVKWADTPVRFPDPGALDYGRFDGDYLTATGSEGHTSIVSTVYAAGEQGF